MGMGGISVLQFVDQLVDRWPGNGHSRQSGDRRQRRCSIPFAAPSLLILFPVRRID